MPKGKDKNEAAGAGVPRNLDVYQRLNFLMQAAQQQHGQQNDNLARYYAGLLRLVAEKTVLRLYVSELRFSAFSLLKPNLTLFFPDQDSRGQRAKLQVLQYLVITRGHPFSPNEAYVERKYPISG